MEHILSILSIRPVTHDVYCIRLEKPGGYTFAPGQAAEVAIREAGWEHEKRPFTFTGLADDPYLELTVKCYKDHDGVTARIARLKEGDQLLIGEPWGAIAYKGPGCFIAGGAGITPFIAILRQLHKEGKAGGNRLFFSNKTSADIIYEQELQSILGKDALFVVTGQDEPGYLHDYINRDFLGRHLPDGNGHFYICGPDAMTSSISDILLQKGADPVAVVCEQ